MHPRQRLPALTAIVAAEDVTGSVLFQHVPSGYVDCVGIIGVERNMVEDEVIAAQPREQRPTAAGILRQILETSNLKDLK